MDEPNLKMILERVAEGSTRSCFKLWACRGEGRGCARNKFRRRTTRCDDCVETHNEETIAALMARMERGDA